MILRAYRREDSPVIAKWIRSEEEMHRWAADHFRTFPLGDYDIDDKYSPDLKTGRLFPLTATDDDGKACGHLLIKYPEDGNDTVRFCFVVVDPDKRGKGSGRELIRLAISFVRDNLNASRITLGVFDNNPKARKCYESQGFTPYSSHEYTCGDEVWNCTDMEINL